MQVLRIDIDGALSLAVQLLPQLFAGPDRRLDEQIYPLWVAAHGILIVTPVNWYRAPTALKG